MSGKDARGGGGRGRGGGRSGGRGGGGERRKESGDWGTSSGEKSEFISVKATMTTEGPNRERRGSDYDEYEAGSGDRRTARREKGGGRPVSHDYTYDYGAASRHASAGASGGSGAGGNASGSRLDERAEREASFARGKGE
eukprot:Rhum_TRINITY_DN14288_c49_g1::Rhum_TRINITY_DN14288_c49_g1_i1::g.74188::m.74188